MTKNLRFYHVILGGFLLPMALVFFITGGLYAANIKANSKLSEWSYSLLGAYSMDSASLSQSVTEQLQSKDIYLPTGFKKNETIDNKKWRRITWKKESFRVNISIKNSEASNVNISVKQPGLLKAFLNLHKTKHSFFYTIYVVIASFGLIASAITGFVILLRDARYRFMGIVSVLLGTVLFAVLISI